jgi:hypothetical protein
MTGLELFTEEYDLEPAVRALGVRAVVHASAYSQAAFDAETVRRARSPSPAPS